MKISRWKLIWGLREELFGVFTCYFVMASGIYLLFLGHFSIKAIIFVIVAEVMSGFLYVTVAFGYIIDIILKNIGETGWIPTENIKLGAVIGGLNHRTLGCEIKVFEEGKKPIKLKVLKRVTSWPDGVISHYKIHYLKNCKAVVGWEVEKEKINLSRKPRKSK